MVEIGKRTTPNRWIKLGEEYERTSSRQKLLTGVLLEPPEPLDGHLFESNEYPVKLTVAVRFLELLEEVTSFYSVLKTSMYSECSLHNGVF